MNFLTHFYFNSGQNHPPDFHFGVALPDILSVYDRRLRFHESAIQRKIRDEPEMALWLGIHNHLAADAFFHQSEFFRKTYNEIRQQLVRRISADHNVRPFFLAHILVEMLTDHVLLKLHPNLAAEFYAAMTAANHKIIQSALEMYFGEKLIGIEKHFEIFLKERFLESYVSLEKILHALNRVIRRTRQEPLGSAFVPVLEDNTQIIEKYFTVFDNELAGKRKAPRG